MGLQEKRLIEEYKRNIVPSLERELHKNAKTKITYEIDWTTFENDLKALHYLENQGLVYLNSVIKEICRDEVGTQAVKESIKKIAIKNAGGSVPKELTLEDGVLEVSCAWANDYYTESELVELIEQKL